MGKTGISWTDETWNPTVGCSRISAGCERCYAERQAARIIRCNPGLRSYDGLIRYVGRGPGNVRGGEPRWTGVVRLVPDRLELPLRWSKPRRIFVDSMSDLFHESLTNEQIAAVFGVMAAAPQHTFQVLTKRAQRMREWFEWALDGTARSGFYDATFLNHLTSKAGLRWEDGPKWLAHCEETEDTCASWPLPNVWLGVSVENQAAADERIPELLRTPAAVRFLSCEPLLGPVDLRLFEGGPLTPRHRLLHWCIAGCESGPGARECDVEWLRSLRDQCEAAGVPFFLKQAVDSMAKELCDDCGAAIRSYVCAPNRAAYSCGCTTEGGEDGAAPFVAAGDGSKRKPGGVIELPYLDGVQHAAFPEVQR